MNNNTCFKCVFFHLFPDGQYGECRKNAPHASFPWSHNMKDSRDVEENIFWPVLGSENWCGEFKAADEDEIERRFTMIENSSNSKRKMRPKLKNKQKSNK